MSQVRTIAKNTAALMAAQLIVMALGLIFIISVARFLGAEGFGKYNFAFAFTGLFAIFADFGLSILMVREVARNKSLAISYITNTAVIKIILSFLTMILIVSAINLMDYPQDTTYAVYIFGLYVILTSFSQIFRSIFKAFEVMEYESLIIVVDKIILVTLSLAVLFSGIKLFDSQLIALVSVFLIVGVSNVLFSFVICFKRVVKVDRKNLTKSITDYRIDFKFWKFLIKEGSPFGIMSIFAIIYFQIDIVMLSMMKGDADVGVYSAAYNLVVALLVIPGVAITVLFPVMSKFFVSSKDSLKIMLEKSVKYIFIIGLPIAIGTTLLAEDIILLFYKKEFLLSIVALQILIWDVPIRFINYITSNNLAAIDKAWIRTNAAIVCCFVNIGANLILIPMYSFKGAAIATILTEIVLFTIYFYFIRKHIYRKIISFNTKILNDYVKIIASGFIMCTFIYLTKTLHIINESASVISLIIIICLSALVYLAVFYLLKGFSQDDKNILRSIVDRKR